MAITHYMLTFSSSCVTLVLGVLLLGIRIPRQEVLGKLRKARAYLAGAYFVLAASGFFSYFMGVEAEKDYVLMACTLFIASCQAFLFTVTCITFVRPAWVTRAIVLRHLSVIGVVGGSLVAISLLPEAGELFPYALYGCVVLYGLQLLRYVHLFRREYGRSLQQVEAYYDEEENHRLRWVKVCFYSALVIGVWALVSIFAGSLLYCLFIVAYTAYYASMVYRFSNYMADAKFLIPALSAGPVPAEGEISDYEQRHLSEKEQRLKAALERWVADKEYCKPDVDVESVVVSLGTNHNFFRHYLKTHMDSDFRAWRMKLRVGEARRLIEERPDVSLDEVCRLAGFNHLSNLHRQFEKIVGMTPTEYRRSLGGR
ncbi:MAG: helix-turn-helix domain-containing protein [Alistipes sp.]|nr:helix-turn-helix domain-containing protein [Alistipes sp.]